MIWAKKRFKVLQRDNFRCQYCWKNWKDVSLEVDHIIPKSKWWTDEFNNLITCCRECNIWKWNDIIWSNNGVVKMKIAEHESETVKRFFSLWNEYWCWTIDKNNLTFLSWFLKHYYTMGTVTWYVKQEIIGKLWKLNWEWKYEFEDFNEWWENCDLALSEWDTFIRENDLYWMLEEIRYDEWPWRKRQNVDDYNERLNRVISEQAVYQRMPKSFLFKYSLFPNKVDEWIENRENM